LRAGESFGIICARDQVSKMERVIQHNDGRAEVVTELEDAVYLAVIKK
jgi:hypothetical protein